MRLFDVEANRPRAAVSALVMPELPTLLTSQAFPESPPDGGMRGLG
jgi:hypothetical protein